MVKGNLFSLIMIFYLSFVVTFIATYIFIRFAKRFGIVQVLKTYGPKRHLEVKKNTVTMGGITFIACALLLIYLASFFGASKPFYLMMCGSLMMSLVGLIDDYKKRFLKNGDGLTSRQKLIGQVVVSVIFVLAMMFTLPNNFYIFLPGIGFIKFAVLVFIFKVFVMVGTTNAVNITDGLDGLAIGTCLISFIVFTVLASMNSLDPLWWNASLFSMFLVGLCMGFLWFNFYPAKVFMGDVGSHFLGGALSVLAVFTSTEVFLLLVGIVFVIETFSVICQIACIKFLGRRILLMSPLHHHYELKGWEEPVLVFRFWFIQAISSFAGIMLFYLGGPIYLD